MSKLILRAVPWRRRLVAGLSPRRPGFASGSIQVGFVVDEVVLGQVSIQVLPFSPVNVIPLSFSILIYHLADEYVR
jgi:small ligand-binding sensory domain FIST